MIDTEIIPARIAACDSALRRAGATCGFRSESGSRYFHLQDRRVRVSAHAANGTNHGLPDARWNAEVRVDLADWRESLSEVVWNIGEPTISDLPADVYFDDHTAASQSMLGTFLHRRRLYQAHYMTGTLSPPVSTDPMRKGTALHTALLEPERFERLVVAYPAGILAKNGAVSTKEAKAFRDEQEAAGRIVLKAEQFAQVKAMAESVKATVGQWLALPSRKEHAVYWTHEATGLPCKARLDWLVIGKRPVVLDLKSCRDASPSGFRRSCEQNGYGLQNAAYEEAVEQVTGETPLFYFLAVENVEPFACALHQIDDESLAASRSLRLQAMGDLQRCIETNDWREPWETSINLLRLRPWAFEELGGAA